MDENSLGEAIRNTVRNFFAEEEGGFAIAFVCAVDFISGDGESRLMISEMDEQPIHRSLGLANYLDAWYRDDAQMQWAGLWSQGATEDDD